MADLFGNPEERFSHFEAHDEEFNLQSIDNISHGNITHRNDIDDESQFLVG